MSEHHKAAAVATIAVVAEHIVDPLSLKMRGCFITDLQRRVLRLNRLAGEISSSHRGVVIKAGLLHAAIREDDQALTSAFSAAACGQDKRIILRSLSGGLMKARLSLLDDELSIFFEIEAVTPSSENMLPHLEAVFGLTRTEGRVLQALATGLSPEQAARMIGMAKATARTHTKRLYAKVGISTRGELMAMLFSLK